MGLLEDILKALDRIDIWKRLQAVPEQVDGLNRRVAGLEEKLGSKYPADVCKACGERALRLVDTYPAERGKITQQWKCQECTKYESRIV